MDERLELAFHHAEAAFAQQVQTLANVRQNASSVLSTGAVLTTLLPALGLLTSDPDRGNVVPLWFPLLATVLLVGIAVCNAVIAAPPPRSGWVVSINARVLIDDWIDGRGASIDDMYRNLALVMRGHEERNKQILAQRAHGYQVQISLLTAQTLVLLVGLLMLAG